MSRGLTEVTLSATLPLRQKGVFLADSFRADNLHPQAKGYDIWGDAVSAKLAELMK